MHGVDNWKDTGTPQQPHLLHCCTVNVCIVVTNLCIVYARLLPRMRMRSRGKARQCRRVCVCVCVFVCVGKKIFKSASTQWKTTNGIILERLCTWHKSRRFFSPLFQLLPYRFLGSHPFRNHGTAQVQLAQLRKWVSISVPHATRSCPA